MSTGRPTEGLDSASTHFQDACRHLDRACRRLDTHVPFNVSAPTVLEDAFDVLDADSTAAGFTAVLGVVGIALACLLTVGLRLASGALSWHGFVGVACLTAVLVGCIGLLPVLAAARRRAAVAGAVPGFVARAALGMQLVPTIEAGANAAFEASDPVTDRVQYTPTRSSSDRIRVALQDGGPAAKRVHGLLNAAPTAADPDALLDRAVETVMTATRQRTREYAGLLQRSVTAIYAFGVVLPLALVGLLPAAPVAGFDLPLGVLALLLDGLLPLCILGVTAWLVARRPFIDPPPRLPSTHEALGERRTTLVAGLLGCGTGAMLATLTTPAWDRFLLPVFWGLGATLLARYQPAVEVLDALDRTQDAIPDLLVLLGDAMADGAPIEHALAQASSRSGEAGTVASDAERVRDRLTLSAPAAVAGPHGPLAPLDDRQTGSLAALLIQAADAGRPGGRALSQYAAHLDDLHDVAASVRTDLAHTTGTLHQTAAVYAPAIGGITVALATRIQDTASELPATGDGFPLVVGGYVLVLAVVLPVLAIGVTDGWSRVRVGTAVGRTLLAAGAIFPLAATLAASLL